ncbi:unnamed protein product [Anisakis simplex]|uniref:Uncharacterized protein n=1 Tax=Anisakis simplex TaxID=6269 RepID=A0A3P6ST39_ANISI|nr:unnamed protein product [Anisakis simplex]
MHQMHCMEALGQWDDLNKFSKKAFDELTPSSDPERKQKMSIIAARGCWAIGRFLRFSCFALIHCIAGSALSQT